MFKPRRKFQTIVVALFLGTLAFFSFAPHKTFASTYGSDSYGNCQYGNGCANSNSGSGDNGGSADTTAPASNVILLNDFSDYFTDAGKDLTLDQGEVIYFDLTEAAVIQHHSITIQTVGPDYVDLVINSDPIQAHLVVGETEQYDVAGKGEKNIQIKLTAITADGKAQMNFKALVASTPQPKVHNGFTLLNIHFNWWIWVLLGSFCLAAGFFIIFFIRRRRRKKEQQLPTPMRQ